MKADAKYSCGYCGKEAERSKIVGYVQEGAAKRYLCWTCYLRDRVNAALFATLNA